MTRVLWQCLVSLVSIAMTGLMLSSAQPASAENHPVRIQDDEFLPKNITIALGDTVVWTNYGSDHTVVADHGSFSSTASGGATIPVGQTFSHTFTTVGSYPYYCLLHGGPGGQDMSGVVRVVAPGENQPPAVPVNLSPGNASVGQSTSLQLAASGFSDGDLGDVHASSQWMIRKVATGVEMLDTGEDATNKTALSVSMLDGAATYGWKVRYRDDRGAWSPYSAETEFTTIDTQAVSGSGLAATYGSYSSRKDTFKILSTQIDPSINFDWALGKPNSSTPANNFFVRWEGTMLPEFSEAYLFRIRADGGVRLWVNNTLLVDDWVATPFAVHRSALAVLQASVPSAIKVEYFDTKGAASIGMRWASPSLPLQVVPRERLFPPQP